MIGNNLLGILFLAFYLLSFLIAVLALLLPLSAVSKNNLIIALKALLFWDLIGMIRFILDLI